MVRSLPSELTAELEKEIHMVCHLFKIELTTTHYWTEFDQDIYYDGQCYSAKTIEFDAAQYSLLPKVDSLNLKIDNVDRFFSNLVLSEDIRGKKCTICKVALNTNLSIISQPVIIFLGYLDAVKCDVWTADMQIFNHFIRWRTPVPRRTHMATCPWVFKDTNTCRYIYGETWCDRSWDRCADLANTINYGGFRWLPFLDGKEVWWGRIPENK